MILRAYFYSKTDFEWEDNNYSERSISKIWEDITKIWGGEPAANQDTLHGLGHRILDKTYENDLKAIWGSDDTSIRIQANGIVSKVSQTEYDTEISKIWGDDSHKDTSHGIGHRVFETDCTAKMATKVDTSTREADLSLIWGTKSKTATNNIEAIWVELNKKTNTSDWNDDKDDLWRAIQKIWGTTGTTYEDTNASNRNIDKIWHWIYDPSSNPTVAGSFEVRLQQVYEYIQGINKRLQTRLLNGTAESLGSAYHSDLNVKETRADNPRSINHLYELIGVMFDDSSTEIIPTFIPGPTRLPDLGENLDPEFVYKDIGDYWGSLNTSPWTILDRINAIERYLYFELFESGGQIDNVFKAFRSECSTEIAKLAKEIYGIDDSSHQNSILVRLYKLEEKYAQLLLSNAQINAVNSQTSIMSAGLASSADLVGDAINNQRDTISTAVGNLATSLNNAIATVLTNAVTLVGGNIKTGEDSIVSAINAHRDTVSNAISVGSSNIVSAVRSASSLNHQDFGSLYNGLTTAFVVLEEDVLIPHLTAIAWWIEDIWENGLGPLLQRIHDSHYQHQQEMYGSLYQKMQDVYDGYQSYVNQIVQAINDKQLNFTCNYSGSSEPSEPEPEEPEP